MKVRLVAKWFALAVFFAALPCWAGEVPIPPRIHVVPLYAPYMSFKELGHGPRIEIFVPSFPGPRVFDVFLSEGFFGVGARPGQVAGAPWVLSSKDKIVLNNVKWDRLPGGALAFSQSGTRGRYRLSGRITATPYVVDLRADLQNLNSWPFRYALLNPGIALRTTSGGVDPRDSHFDPFFADFSLNRVFYYSSRGWTPLRKIFTPSRTGADNTRSFALGGVPQPLLPADPFSARPVPIATSFPAGLAPTLGVMAAVSQDRQWVVGIAWQDAARIASNALWPCMHVMPRVENVPPGKSAHFHGRLYFLHGTLNDLLVLVNRDLGASK
ncbi:MAG TPA: hypothetical protein VMW54_10155 [Terriglobia bacterium]|nr:hypothetical protein [Terriglobia bacterium]